MPTTSIQARASGNENGAMFNYPAIGAVNPFTFFTINLAGTQGDPIPAWSYYPQVRDIYLRALSKNEPIMVSALYSMVSRIKSLRWNIKGGRNDKKYYQRLFAEADGGAGYGQFISKVVTDLLTQDNGAFIELVGGGKEDRPLRGRVREMWHMDSAQCWRTFDPEYPVIYVNPMDNSYHRMHHSRVIMLSSYPQPDERARGIGFCAVSRALKLMQTMRAIQQYREEKISGRFKRGLIYGNGVTVKQFDEAVERSEQISESVNFTVYNEIPVLLSMMPDMKLNMLDLASLPDGFDWEKELTLYVYSLALAIGTDAREFWPATSSGATKADATVQHMKAQGKGQADIIKSLETAFNWHVMPENGNADFEYDFTDDEQDKLVAELKKLKAENIAIYQQNGWIDAFEGRNLAISEGLIDPKALITVVAPEPAEDSNPVEDDLIAAALPLDQPVAQGDQPLDNLLTDEDDPEFEDDEDEETESGSRADPEQIKVRAGKYDESKHVRGPGGKFAPKPDSEKVKKKADPFAQRLNAFLGLLNRQGTFKDGVLTIPDQSRDRSAELQDYLRAKGYPDAVVKATQVGGDMVYSFGGVPIKTKGRKGRAAKPKKEKKPKQQKQVKAPEKKTEQPTKQADPDLADNAGADDQASQKTIPMRRRSRRRTMRTKIVRSAQRDFDLEQYIAEYEAALDELYNEFIDNVLDSPDDYDQALDDLQDQFFNNLPEFLTLGFGVGLSGEQPTDSGVTRLKKIAETSADYFQDSFLAALGTLGLAALAIPDIRAALEGLRARFLMYAGAMWNAIWEGLRDKTPDTIRVRRVLEPGAAHCETCPDKEREYNSFQAMVDEVGLPGDGSDDCLTNCRCYLEVETEPGSGVFVKLAGEPTVFVTPLFEVLRNGSTA